MRRSISDLLDDYPAGTMELGTDTPLSSSRIKELTMSKITERTTAKKRMNPRVLVAVALAAALSVSAMAATNTLGVGDLFRGYFTRGGEDLTPGQMEIMDVIGKTFDDPVTDNGATLTPLAVLADENVCYFHLRVEAPEGTVLPDLAPETEGYYQLFYAGKGEKKHLRLEPAQGSGYTDFGWSASIDWLPDADPADNRKEAVVVFYKSEEADYAFNDGVSKVLTIPGLWVQSPDKGYTEVFQGEFSFDIGLYYEDRTVALDCAGLTWRDETYGFTNTLERLTLSPLSISYRYNTTTLPENDWIVPGVGYLRIVMKDGTVFFGAESSPSASAGVVDPKAEDLPKVREADHPAQTISGYAAFDQPLDLTQVDYVQYGESKIFVHL